MFFTLAQYWHRFDWLGGPTSVCKDVASYTWQQRFAICTPEKKYQEFISGKILCKDNPSICFLVGQASQKNIARQQNKSNSEERREPSMSNSDEWRQMEEAAAEASQASRGWQLFGLWNSKWDDHVDQTWPNHIKHSCHPSGQIGVTTKHIP